MSPGNKDIVRNSSYNSLRAAPWRLAKQLPSETLKLLQQAAVAMKFLKARKTVLLFQLGAQTGDLSPAFMSLTGSSLINSIELAFRMYLGIFEIPGLEFHSYARKQKKGTYVVLSGFQSFWDFLCHRGSCLILIVGYLWRGTWECEET